MASGKYFTVCNKKYSTKTLGVISIITWWLYIGCTFCKYGTLGYIYYFYRWIVKIVQSYLFCIEQKYVMTIFGSFPKLPSYCTLIQWRLGPYRFAPNKFQ